MIPSYRTFKKRFEQATSPEEKREAMRGMMMWMNTPQKRREERREVEERSGYLSPATVVTMYPIRPTTLYKLMKAGKIPKHKIEGKTLIKKSDMDRYFESRRRTRR